MALNTAKLKPANRQKTTTTICFANVCTKYVFVAEEHFLSARGYMKLVQWLCLLDSGLLLLADDHRLDDTLPSGSAQQLLLL